MSRHLSQQIVHNTLTLRWTNASERLSTAKSVKLLDLTIPGGTVTRSGKLFMLLHNPNRVMQLIGSGWMHTTLHGHFDSLTLGWRSFYAYSPPEDSSSEWDRCAKVSMPFSSMVVHKPFLFFSRCSILIVSYSPVGPSSRSIFLSEYEGFIFVTFFRRRSAGA